MFLLQEDRTHKKGLCQICRLECKEGVVHGADHQVMLKDSSMWWMAIKL